MAEEFRNAIAAMLPRLRRFGLALTGSPTDADDLVQSACERALARHHQLRAEDRLDGWVYGIMRHLWLDEARSRRVRRHETMEAAGELPGDDGEAVAENRLTLSAVRRCLGELSPNQRTVLVLVCVDGLSYAHAAEILGVPVGTVMSRVARARQALADRLATRTGTATAVIPLSGRRGRHDC